VSGHECDGDEVSTTPSVRSSSTCTRVVALTSLLLDHDCMVAKLLRVDDAPTQFVSVAA
jgi:hypothetical protein